MQDFYRIPEEIAEKIREESIELVRMYRDKVEKFDAYSNFVESQKKGFQEDVDIILNAITDLIMKGKLYIHTKVVARIKDPESALHNDDINQMDKNVLMGIILDKIDESDYEIKEKPIEEKNKACYGKVLDDVFGITVITDTQEEVEILNEVIKKLFNVQKEKKMNKKNYHATHLSLWANTKDEESPIIECQLKTRQEYITSYDHTLYKVETNIERKLREDNKIKDNEQVILSASGAKKVESIIQEFYENGRFNIFTNIPRMWEATFNEENEKMELKALTEGQILKRVYPSLIIHSDRLIK